MICLCSNFFQSMTKFAYSFFFIHSQNTVCICNHVPLLGTLLSEDPENTAEYGAIGEEVEGTTTRVRGHL